MLVRVGIWVESVHNDDSNNNRKPDETSRKQLAGPSRACKMVRHVAEPLGF